MPDGITLKRIIDMDETEQLSSSDYVLVDSQTGGNRKYPLGEKLPQMDEDLKQAKEDLETKADKDGSYDDLTSGNAKQLVSTVFTEDQTPYLFRTTGGSADVGDREYVDSIVGGTVAWNQLVRDPLFAEYSSGKWAEEGIETYTLSDGVLSITPNNAASRLSALYGVNKKGHKYLMSAFYKGTEGNASLSWYGVVIKSVALTGSWQDVATVINSTYDDNNAWQYFFQVGSNTNLASYQIKYPQVIDLTQLFGTAIADYIYSLETANAGAGVAWFKKLFPNMDAEYSDNGVTKFLRDYQPGTLISVGGVSAHKTIEFNAWDEEWEAGTISNENGENIVDYGKFRSKNYIRLASGQDYYFEHKTSDVIGVRYYDSDKNFIGTYAITTAEGSLLHRGTASLPNNAMYMRFVNTSTNVYNNDICINLSWDGEKDGTYEPYVEHSYPLDADVVLRGIPKLDASNNLYYDGDEYLPDGTVNRRYGVVDLGTLEYNELNHRFNSKTAISDALGGNHANCVCAIYISDTGSANRTVDKSISYANNGYVYIYDTSFTGDDTAFKTAMNGVYLVYELATPTTETADSYQQIQICDDFGTEEFVSTSPVPVGHNTRYVPNLRAKLEMSPDSPDGDGVYVVQQSNGENAYIPLGSAPTIQNILDRLTALENA